VWQKLATTLGVLKSVALASNLLHPEKGHHHAGVRFAQTVPHTQRDGDAHRLLEDG